MKQFVTRGIVLTRTNFGEADRILTVLTPTEGKLRLIAKGVRRAKSKIAGGIELFSISDITCIRGRGEIGTLVSARLERHFRHIVEDLDRTMLGYELLKQVNWVTEDETEEEYFTLLAEVLALLDDHTTNIVLVKAWFGAQLLAHAGYSPELHHDSEGANLNESTRYLFDAENAVFLPRDNGTYGAQEIKLLRLLFSTTPYAVLSRVGGVSEVQDSVAALVATLAKTHLHK